MKKYLPLVGFGMLSASAFAEGGSDGLATVSQSVSTQVTAWTTSITTFFTDNVSSLLSIAGIGIGIALLWGAYKLFKRATSKAA